MVLVFDCFWRRNRAANVSSGVIGVEQLCAALILDRRDASRLLLGFDGRFAVLKVAACQLGAFFCAFVEPAKMIRKFNCLAQGELL